MNRCALSVLGPILITISGVGSAHHSRAEFTGDVIELQGELVNVEWINPHPYFTLRLSDGSADVWQIQLYGSATGLGNAGVDASFFPVGERITVAGLASSRRENVLLGSHALLPSGLEAVLQRGAAQYWSGDSVGGSRVIDESVLARAAGEDKGIFRVWTISDYTQNVGAFVRLRDQLRGTALDGLLELFDIPDGSCGPPAMPWAMATPTLREFIDNGHTLTLNIAHLAGGSRTIYLTEAGGNVPETSSRMGRSLGRWEGSTLIVETDLIEPPVSGLQSPEMKMTERFTLSDDQSRISYELVLDDPIAFEEPATFQGQYLALGDDYLPNCEAP